ncbi:hypothetical protein FDF40_04150 [Clostridium sporogenes]|uniref:HNH endonuclease n=1 Tax=Clostridium sporogenes TaxID=1509 RepID=UPI0013D4AF43|nr:HNH endonuclease [Clostridium sporogenes]NFT30668.1 hypothetical protein [Clostridium sporogenes]
MNKRKMGVDRKGVVIWKDENNKRVCSVENCFIKHNKQGYCVKHYRELKEDKVCKVENCYLKILASNLCTRHYKQKYRNGETVNRTIYDKNEIILHSQYAEIKMFDKYGKYGASTIIDIEDVDKVKKYKWHLNDNGYVRSRSINTYIHRFLLNAVLDDVDHINHDTLDNRKGNLRECSHSDNNKNSVKVNSNTGIRGVYYSKNNNKYYSSIHSNGKRYATEFCETLSEALNYREIMELYLHKEYSPKYDYLLSKYGEINEEEFLNIAKYISNYS